MWDNIVPDTATDNEKITRLVSQVWSLYQDCPCSQPAPGLVSTSSITKTPSKPQRNLASRIKPPPASGFILGGIANGSLHWAPATYIVALRLRIGDSTLEILDFAARKDKHR
jgi:hypothetical protein